MAFAESSYLTPPRNDIELDELLSRPSPADCRALKELDGDLLILGAGGKMGPSLVRLARRAVVEAGIDKRIIGVSRFSDPGIAASLAAEGIEVIHADLFDREALSRLPSAANVIFMAARKFGTSGDECGTWATNAYLPMLVSDRFADSRIVAFSTGNVYPLTLIGLGGCDEKHPVGPIG